MLAEGVLGPERVVGSVQTESRELVVGDSRIGVTEWGHMLLSERRWRVVCRRKPSVASSLSGEEWAHMGGKPLQFRRASRFYGVMRIMARHLHRGSVMNRPLAKISDDDLIRRLRFLVRDERGRMVQVIAHLAEGEARGLFTKLGHSSSQYCRNILHFSEHEAYLRICAARCALRFPVILKQLAEGSVNLTTIRLLSPHLTEDNHLELLAEARHKSKFEVKEMVARLDPQAPVPPSVWELPQVSPLAPNLYKIEFTAGLNTYEKLRQLQALLRHRVPTGDI